MSINPVRQTYICFNCGQGRIGKVVTQELRNPENYLEGVVIITTYICLHCQTVLHQEKNWNYHVRRKIVAHHEN